jgi:hypothetical protein
MVFGFAYGCAFPAQEMRLPREYANYLNIESQLYYETVGK